MEFNNGDEEFIEQDDPLNEGDDVEPHEENHMDVFREDAEYELNQSFEEDEDSLVKVKAKVMFNINKERQLEEIPMMFEDLSLTSVAMQYASSIKNGNVDESYLAKLVEKEKVPRGEYEICHIISKYEDDATITNKLTERFFIESAYVFFEMDSERELLMHPQNTHIGVGLAGNGTNIAIVLLITRKELTISEIVEVEEDRVEVRGRILSPNQFIYMVDILDSKSNEVASSMYDKVDFNRQTKDFVIKLDMRTAWNEKRWIQIFLTATEPISTRKPPSLERRKKMKKDLESSMSLFYLYPDKRYIQYYNEEFEAEA